MIRNNFQTIFNYCDQVKSSKKLFTSKVRCDFPQIFYELNKNGFKAYGADISVTII